MKIIESIKSMQAQSLDWKRGGFKVGVVPTMGALHEGHLSLIDLIKPHVDKIIVTLFVNPTQFGEGEDFSKYPRTFEEDCAKCRDRGVDALFFPSNEEMYDEDCSTFVEEEKLTFGLCGASRPGHFRGVTTVVAKLYNAVLPDFAVFGEKDFQQLQVLKRMTRDLNFPVEVLAAPIFRESDGLAMSSRNRYLQEKERNSAVTISKSLKEAAGQIRNGAGILESIESVKKSITDSEGKVDYVKVVDSNTLEELDQPVAGSMRILAAAYYGPARLIDNMEV